MKEENKMEIILKLFATAPVAIGLVIGSSSAFSATHCPVLVSEIKTDTN